MSERARCPASETFALQADGFLRGIGLDPCTDRGQSIISAYVRRRSNTPHIFDKDLFVLILSERSLEIAKQNGRKRF